MVRECWERIVLTQRIISGGIAGLILALVLCSHCLAGPVAAIEFEDGGRQVCEIIDFGEGSFWVRELESEVEKEILEAEIRSIDFGEVPIELGLGGAIIMPEGPDAVRCLQWAVEERHFDILWKTCWIERFLVGHERLREFEKWVRRRLRDGNLDPQTRRDLLLSQVVMLTTVGRDAEALQRLRRIAGEFPNDAVVRAVAGDMQRREVARGSGSQPAPPEGRQ